MYESFYKLRLDPFLMTPDTRFVFAQDNYTQALSHLIYGLTKGEGFVVVTGEPGTGKSTVIDDLLLRNRERDLVIARLLTPQLEVDELLRMVGHAFGIEHGAADKVDLLINIEEFLLEKFRLGKRVLLIIDEAQNLSIEGLEQLRLLTNIQSHDLQLHLQIFLLGQPSLRDSIRSDGVEQLRQRIIAYCDLEPLSLTETRAYIQHRLQTAGWRGDPEFSATAITRIHDFSSGIPRRINLICGCLLLNGFAEQKHSINLSDVDEVIAEMPPEMVEREILDRMAKKGESPLADMVNESGESYRHRTTGIAAMNPPAIKSLGVPDVSVAANDPTEPVDTGSESATTVSASSEPALAFEPIVAEKRHDVAAPHRSKRRYTVVAIVLLVIFAGLGVGFYGDTQLKRLLHQEGISVDFMTSTIRKLEDMWSAIGGATTASNGLASEQVEQEKSDIEKPDLEKFDIGKSDIESSDIENSEIERSDSADSMVTGDNWEHENSSVVTTSDTVNDMAVDEPLDSFSNIDDATSIPKQSENAIDREVTTDQPTHDEDIDVASEELTEIASTVNPEGHPENKSITDESIDLSKINADDTSETPSRGLPDDDLVDEISAAPSKGEQVPLAAKTVDIERDISSASSFADSGVIISNGQPTVSPSLEAALRSHVKEMRRIENGSLSVTPLGDFEYAFTSRRWDGFTESSLNAITYVIRNFHSIDVNIVARGNIDLTTNSEVSLTDSIADYLRDRGVIPMLVEVIDSPSTGDYLSEEGSYLEIEIIIKPSVGQWKESYGIHVNP